MAREIRDLRDALELIAYPDNHPEEHRYFTFKQWASSVAANALTNAGKVRV
jgi:hypothetical protein